METETTTMDHSPGLGALAKALAQAQSKLEDAKKDRDNPAFKGTRYATLASVRASLRTVLPEFGLATVQTFEPHGPDGVVVVTTLIHESGEWMRSRLYLPVTKKDAQGFGSAITYARRYSLAAIVGVASDDDDDGNEAVKPEPTPRRAAPRNDVANPFTGDPEVMSHMEGLSVAISSAANVEALMRVWNDVTVSALPPVAKDLIKGKLSARRRELEGRAA